MTFIRFVLEYVSEVWDKYSNLEAFIISSSVNCTTKQDNYVRFHEQLGAR